MFIAFIITLIFALVAWIQTIHCCNRSKIHDGNLEGLGVFIYGAIAVVTTVLAVIFGIIAGSMALM